MSAPANAPKVRINLERAVVLAIDNQLGLDILSAIFLGFGVRNLHRARTLAEAQEILQNFQIDLIVMENLLPDEDAYEFVETLRLRRTQQPIKLPQPPKCIGNLQQAL